jgi:putative ABC transport system ATP-binding protein
MPTVLSSVPVSDSATSGSAVTIDLSSSRLAAPAHPLGGRDVHVIDLTIRYQGANDVVVPVSNFNLYAPSSHVTALVGRSGSGKTSILSCIAAMLRPKSGAIWLGGIEVSALSGKALDQYRRHRVGVVHQAYNLIPSLSAVENVTVPLRLIGVSRGEAKNRAHELLTELGMLSHSAKRPHELSGGQQQRIAIARALATNPSVVLADEPTAHLDGSSVSDVSALLRSIAATGRTVIISTHDDRLLSTVDQTVHLGVSTPMDLAR